MNDTTDWTTILTDRDRRVFSTAGYGERAGFGERPAVLVIDVNYAFVGIRAPIEESMSVWPQSSGDEAWEVVDRLAAFLDVARAVSVPLIYTTNQPPGRLAAAMRSRKKLPLKRRVLPAEQVERGRRIVDEIAPQPDDVVIEKPHASAFFDTPLTSVLHGLDVDTLLIVGGTTSGCVRATAVDACALNYYTTVIADGTFDRAQASKMTSLFDLDAKYADVVALDEALDYLRTSARPAEPAATT